MSSYKIRKTPGDTEWFRHDRFGMFIHFGLYSMPARHEWIKYRECMTDEQYDKYLNISIRICSARVNGQSRPRQPA